MNYPSVARVPTFAVLFALAGGAASAAPTTPLKVKPGAWEMTHTMRLESHGAPPGTDPLSPEQRARFEAAMQARAKNPRARTHRQCVTKQKLDRMAFDTHDTECTNTNMQSSATRWEADTTCKVGAHGHSVIEAPSSDKVSGKTVMHMPANQGSATTTMEITGRWISDSCEGITRR